jgi:hypothetical protein
LKLGAANILYLSAALPLFVIGLLGAAVKAVLGADAN